MTVTLTLLRGNQGVRKPTVRPKSYRAYTQRDFDRITPLSRLPPERRFAMQVVANVLPFRVNDYVIDELIDWDRVPEDPLFQLTFPQPGMLAPAHFARLARLTRLDPTGEALVEAAQEIREQLNPHPAGQIEHNTPCLADGQPLFGLQHKYRETLLFFPSQGQTCHAYCSFCFRWAQFIGDKALRIASREAERLHAYLRQHHQISDLLLTGGDPMVMKASHLASYLEPLLRPEFAHVQTIRIGTKAISFWPHRFLTDPDSDALLALFERLTAAGKHLAIMAHFNHWRELETQAAHQAVARIRATGAEIRSQSPLLAHINDDPDVWARLWRTQVRLGIIPYYMFVERDTGAHRYFKVPLARAHGIYRQAIRQVSGIGRTARGPSMSATPGKIEVQGIARVKGEKVIVLRFLQGRNPDWVNRPFFARYDEDATWLDQLQPAFGETRFFFQDEFEERWPGAA